MTRLRKFAVACLTPEGEVAPGASSALLPVELATPRPPVIPARALAWGAFFSAFLWAAIYLVGLVVWRVAL